MPFKTRRQKLAAASRRFTETTSISISYEGKSGNYADNEEPKIRSNTDIIKLEKLDYVGGDIFKTILVASAIFASQLTLSLLLA